MTKKPEPNKVEPWRELEQWDDILQDYVRLAERFVCDRFECPDCEQLLIAPIGTIKFYKICPFCGKMRYGDEQ